MIEIPLTKGQVALIDESDFELVNQYKWSISNSHGKYYACTRPLINGVRTTLYMHRFILNPSMGFEVDHINGNGLHNYRNNLRLATHSQNKMNTKKIAGCSSKYKGVYQPKGKNFWQAYIKKQHIGVFACEIEAALAYDAKARELFGEFARPNFPEGVSL